MKNRGHRITDERKKYLINKLIRFAELFSLATLLGCCLAGLVMLILNHLYMPWPAGTMLKIMLFLLVVGIIAFIIKQVTRAHRLQQERLRTQLNNTPK